MEKLYKYMDDISAEIYYVKKSIRYRDAAFGADCLTCFKILKIITVGLIVFNSKSKLSKKWILVMLARIVTCCKNCQILIRSPLR